MVMKLALRSLDDVLFRQPKFFMDLSQHVFKVFGVRLLAAYFLRRDHEIKVDLFE